MSDKSFLDTNLFLYHLDDSDVHKHAIATHLIREALATGRGCISYQVIQECLNAALRKAHIRLDRQTAGDYLQTVLFPLWQVMPSPELYQSGLDIQQRYSFHFYDALIVAAALNAGCTRLWSEDMQHGQRIEQRLYQLYPINYLILLYTSRPPQGADRCCKCNLG
jgi:predicted nucleic acid-binding protein